MSQQQADIRVLPDLTLGWVLRRTLLGIAILTLLVTGGALLTYHGIDQDANAAVADSAREDGTD